MCLPSAHPHLNHMGWWERNMGPQMKIEKMREWGWWVITTAVYNRCPVTNFCSTLQFAFATFARVEKIYINLSGYLINVCFPNQTETLRARIMHAHRKWYSQCLTRGRCSSNIYWTNGLSLTALMTAMFTHICQRWFWNAGSQGPHFKSDLAIDTARTSVLAVIRDNLCLGNAALQNWGHLPCSQWQLQTVAR